MIKLENVSLDIYGAKRRILSGINWHIRPGENWILFGRNGSGKTKLLEVITGYIYPSGGEVCRFGEAGMGHDIRDTRTRIGYISSALKEKFTMHETLLDSVLGGLYASVGLYRKPSQADTERASRLIADAGFGGREHDTIGHLSDGEKQKVMMLRALINNPELLIFDEPAAGLDIVAREELLESISAVAGRKNIAVVYVTHHVEEIVPLFDKIFIIDKGSCFFSGTINDALSKNKFSEVFGRRIEVIQRNSRFHSSVN
ncbi:MAG TPA: ATP-binding cassette domain-containing protein [Spirochaetota bacterium]|nr:ATP-binding cassette domain-containing protein [Spirochaetota bacterium]